MERISIASIDEIATISVRVNRFTAIIQSSMQELQASIKHQIETLKSLFGAIKTAADFSDKTEARLKIPRCYGDFRKKRQVCSGKHGSHDSPSFAHGGKKRRAEQL